VKIATDYNSHLGLLCSEYCEVWSKPAYPLHGGRGYPITPIISILSLDERIRRASAQLGFQVLPTAS